MVPNYLLISEESLLILLKHLPIPREAAPEIQIHVQKSVLDGSVT